MRNPANKQTNKQTNRQTNKHTKVIAISHFSRDNDHTFELLLLQPIANLTFFNNFKKNLLNIKTLDIERINYASLKRCLNDMTKRWNLVQPFKIWYTKWYKKRFVIFLALETADVSKQEIKLGEKLVALLVKHRKFQLLLQASEKKMHHLCQFHSKIRKPKITQPIPKVTNYPKPKYLRSKTK